VSHTTQKNTQKNTKLIATVEEASRRDTNDRAILVAALLPFRIACESIHPLTLTVRQIVEMRNAETRIVRYARKGLQILFFILKKKEEEEKVAQTFDWIRFSTRIKGRVPPSPPFELEL